MTCDKCGSGMVTRIRNDMPSPHFKKYAYKTICETCGYGELWGEVMSIPLQYRKDHLPFLKNRK